MGDGGEPGCLAQQRARCVDHDGVARMSPDRQVCPRIACVIEAPFAEAVHEGAGLGAASEVRLAVAGEGFAEQPEMIRHGLGGATVGGGDEVEWAPGAVLLPEMVEKTPDPREAVHGHMDPSRQLGLQKGTAAEPPEQGLDQMEGMLFPVADESLPEEIGPDQRAVEIHAERDRVGIGLLCFLSGLGHGAAR